MQLFTIGYEGWELTAFLDYLATHSIECIIDVRENPFSRKPGFSKGSLTRALEAAGMQYVHLRELGTPRPLRDAVKADGNYASFFQAMRGYLATQQEAIEQACSHVTRMVCCLMCYEKSVDACHRKIVAEVIRNRLGDFLEVRHLPLD